MTALLELEHASKSFGSVRVIDDLSLRVEEGEALGVVGPNGAGKTTMMNLIGGSIPLDAGRLVFDGTDISRMAAHRRCRAGIARTHQIPQPFVGLTVFENVLVGVRFGRTGAVLDPHEATMEILERARLADRPNVLAGSLTLLQRKRLELARALATEPRLLLLDEIAGGLIEAEVDELTETIRDLRSGGTTIVWIEHVVHALLSVVDRLLAIDFGRVLKEGVPAEVIASREVQAVYMGVEDE
ncbi:MAG: ABC transporter ATP-binding protein [Actinomycetota bacterium]